MGTTQKGDLAPGISEENNPLEEAGASREIEKDGRAHAVKQTHGDDAKQAWDGSGLEGCLGPKSDACNKSSANVVDKVRCMSWTRRHLCTEAVPKRSPKAFAIFTFDLC